MPAKRGEKFYPEEMRTPVRRETRLLFPPRVMKSVRLLKLRVSCIPKIVYLDVVLK